jgi:hypothetical protein
MNLFEKVENWVWHVAAGKIVKRGVVLGAAWVTAQNLDRFGLKVEIDPRVVEASVWVGLELARNFLKTRYGWKWI